MTTSDPLAVVLLSGGLDSATVLALAQSQGFACHALSFDYGQRHRFELDAARRVAAVLGVEDHRIVSLGLDAIGGSALTDSIPVPKGSDRMNQCRTRRQLQWCQWGDRRAQVLAVGSVAILK